MPPTCTWTHMYVLTHTLTHVCMHSQLCQHHQHSLVCVCTDTVIFCRGRAYPRPAVFFQVDTCFLWPLLSVSCLSLFPVQYRATWVHMTSRDVFMTVTPYTSLASPQPHEAAVNILRRGRVKSVRLCNPVDCSLPGSSIHGIIQARVLEWVAILFSRGLSLLRDQNGASCFDSLPSELPGKPVGRHREVN